MWAAAGVTLGSLAACRTPPPPPPQPSRGQLVIELHTAGAPASGSLLYLDPVAVQEAPARAPRRVDVASDGTAFRPPFTAIQRGDEIRFVNRGAVAHRIFIVDARGRHERILGPRSQAPALRIPRAGRHRFYCSLHPDESFVVLASPSPHFLVPEGASPGRIDEIPTGRYRMSWWSETGVHPLGTVEIRPGEIARRVIRPPAAAPDER